MRTATEAPKEAGKRRGCHGRSREASGGATRRRKPNKHRYRTRSERAPCGTRRAWICRRQWRRPDRRGRCNEKGRGADCRSMAARQATPAFGTG